MRQILEWLQDMSDNREFMDLLKSDLDLFSDDVYCFTPAERSRTFRSGPLPLISPNMPSTLLWSQNGRRKVNDKIVNIDYEIKNGDRIEILTSPKLSKGPSLDWLSFRQERFYKEQDQSVV